jgi:hypothetical protein
MSQIHPNAKQYFFFEKCFIFEDFIYPIITPCILFSPPFVYFLTQEFLFIYSSLQFIPKNKKFTFSEAKILILDSIF